MDKPRGAELLYLRRGKTPVGKLSKQGVGGWEKWSENGVRKPRMTESRMRGLWVG